MMFSKQSKVLQRFVKQFCSQTTPFQNFITKKDLENNPQLQEMCDKYEKQLSKVINEKTTKNIQNFQQDLTEHQKNRVDFMVNYILNLSPEETQLYSFYLRDNLQKVNTVNPLTINAQWPILQQRYSSPYQITEKEDQLGEFNPQGVLQFSSIFGSGGGTAAANTGAKETAAEETPKVEEKTSFNVELTSFDASLKIKIIKEIRTVLGLGLKEAKETVEKAPMIIQKDMKKADAEELQGKLNAIGCVITLV